MSDTNPHVDQAVYATGTPLESATGVVILIHGRGATAPSILELASAIPADGVAYLAPQAAGNVWYPYSFLAPMEQNEPGLPSALQAVDNLVNQVQAAGIPTDHIILGGFSQGACLASEYAARNAQRYGGLMVFSGGLIGPPGTPRDYPGSFDGMPVFVGCSDVDPHIPLVRVNETADTLAEMGATVDKRIYPGMPHTIIEDEITAAQALLKQALGSR